MTGFRYSWSQALFVGEPLAAGLGRLSRLGYHGVELPVTAGPSAEVASLLTDHGLAATSVNGSFIGADRDLSISDRTLRSAAVGHVRRSMDYAARIGAPVVIVVPTRIGKLRPETTLDEEWRNAVRSLAEIGEAGAALGVTVVIECVNRAESYLANRLETARRLVDAAGAGHLALMADSFHMNIEEDDTAAALRQQAALLRHVHLADNNRAAPGMGHLDLATFLGTLAETGYGGAITMECEVQAPDAYGRNASTTDPAVFDAYAATAIATLRRIEANLPARVPSPSSAS